MARQVSPIVKLRGRIDDLSFYKSQDGHMARQVGDFNMEDFKTAESYDVTRRNASEFGIAGQAGKTFRLAFSTEINKASDSRLISRVVRAMIKVLQTDTASEYGFRRVENGTFKDLEDLEFNQPVPFSSAVTPAITATVDRTNGQVTLNFPAYIPKDDLDAPTGATHYNFFGAVAGIDFLNDDFTCVRKTTADLVYDKTATVATTMQFQTLPDIPYPMFIVIGIHFMKKVNGVNYRLSENESSLKLLAISLP
jgi:hypothetical protein